jgi:protein-S-isoprenylcysteine O-methyltransferase Ste14
MWFKHIVSIVSLPVSILVFFPASLIALFGMKLLWGNYFLSGAFVLIFGLVFLALGLILLIYTISLFVSDGEGTIAPWYPTKHLVKRGIYGCVRNPMMMGVFLVLMGECFVFGSLALVFYLLVFIAANLLYVPLIEEPKLVRRFGDEYLKYKKEVPRWLSNDCLRKKG